MANPNQTPLLDAMQNQLQIEFSTSDSIDTKALAAVAGNIAILIFIGQSELDLHAWYVMSLILAFAISLALSIVAIWPRRYSGASVSISQHQNYLQLGTNALVQKLLADTEDAINNNVDLNQKRWKFCKWAYGSAGVALLALFIVLYLSSNR